jgi:hypothetical protein
MTTIRLCRAWWRDEIDDVGAAGGSFWPPRSVITVGFLDPDPDLESVTMRWARALAAIAGLEFRVVPAQGEPPRPSGPNNRPAEKPRPAQIRIRFTSEGGGWSRVGTDCENVKRDEPTMTLGIRGQSSDEQRRVTLHEFCHALGLIHEHQSPAGGIRWNKEKVYDYYAGHGKHYTRKWVDENVFYRYSKGVITNYTAFDPQSIMVYGVPGELTLDGKGLPWNTLLSPTDEAFLRRVYQNPKATR